MDALIGSLEALIAKKRAIKQAAMQQLLTGRTRLPGFSGEWRTRRLERVAVITMGQSPPSASYNVIGDGLPLIQGKADIVGRSTVHRTWTSEPTKFCAAGDIVLTVRAPVGAVATASGDACLGRGVCGLKPLSDTWFLYYALSLVESKWEDVGQGSTFSAADSSQVAAFRIAIPNDRSEQHAIAAVLTDMDAEIDALERRLDKTRAVKQGMMQQLLTGSIRLPIPDAVAENGSGR
ncbi:MAG: restriction endonuclease subunit S [Gemmatimonadetes bacterium]|nr:restriction endonuclease subunit S [Gemmatimonadota bacterium]